MLAAPTPVHRANGQPTGYTYLVACSLCFRHFLGGVVFKEALAEREEKRRRREKKRKEKRKRKKRRVRLESIRVCMSGAH